MPDLSLLSLATLVICCCPVAGGQSALESLQALPECRQCDTSRCPPLHHCSVETVKDSCNCCDVCPTTTRTSTTPAPDGACSQVQCPKFKVCKENIQGLPLCTCPNAGICETRKRRDICSTEGKTYSSRCHLRVEACNQGRRIKVAHRGACEGDEGNDADSEIIPRRNKNKRRRKKKKRKNKLSKIMKVKNRRQRRRQKQQRKRMQDDQRRRRRRRDRFRPNRHSRRLAPGRSKAGSGLVS